MNNLGKLYVVGTPIGNLQEMTQRAIETLNIVDYVLCEDTRISLNLFGELGIKTKLVSYYKDVERDKTERVINDLKNGKNVAIISDAGMPCISDPGAYLVNEAIKENITVIPVSGPSALTLAYAASGFLSPRFIFHGFLHNAKKELEGIKYNLYPTIIYESPKRIKNTLKVIDEIMPEREIFIGREITKKFETFYKGKAKELIDIVNELGEFVLIISEIENVSLDDKNITLDFHYKYYLNKGFSKNEIIKKIAKDLNMKKSDIYNNFIDY